MLKNAVSAKSIVQETFIPKFPYLIHKVTQFLEIVNSSIKEENSSVIHYFTSLCDSYVTFLKFLMTYNTSIIASLSLSDFEMILQHIDYFL